MQGAHLAVFLFLYLSLREKKAIFGTILGLFGPYPCISQLFFVILHAKLHNIETFEMTTTLLIGFFIPLLGTMLGASFVFFMKRDMPERLQKALPGSPLASC